MWLSGGEAVSLVGGTGHGSLCFMVLCLSEQAKMRGDGPRAMTEDDRSPLLRAFSLYKGCEVYARLEMPREHSWLSEG